MAKRSTKKTVARSARKSVANKRSNKKAVNATRGPVSEFSGKKLYPSKMIAKTNPRRKGVHGYVSLEIIRKHPGITYDAFRSSGGRSNDLRWDVGHKHVEVRA